MNVKSYIKAQLAMNQMTMAQLADRLSAITGKKYTRDSLNGKFYRETLTVKEMGLIAGILNFSVEYKSI